MESCVESIGDEIYDHAQREIARITDKIVLTAISKVDPQLAREVKTTAPDDYGKLIAKYALEDRAIIINMLNEPGEQLFLDGTLLLELYPPEVSVQGTQLNINVPHKIHV